MNPQFTGSFLHWDCGFPAHTSGAQYAHWPVGVFKVKFEGPEVVEFEVEVAEVEVEVEEEGLEVEGLEVSVFAFVFMGANIALSTSRRISLIFKTIFSMANANSSRSSSAI